MKQNILSIRGILLVLGIAAIGLSSCRKQKGPDPRDPFLGIYDVVDVTSFDTLDYRVDIFKEGNSEIIVLSGDGLYDAGLEVEAAVTGSKIIIPIQRYLVSSSTNTSYEFTGNGNFDGSTLIVSYTVLTIQDDIVISTDSGRAVMKLRI